MAMVHGACAGLVEALLLLILISISSIILIIISWLSYFRLFVGPATALARCCGSRAREPETPKPLSIGTVASGVLFFRKYPLTVGLMCEA